MRGLTLVDPAFLGRAPVGGATFRSEALVDTPTGLWIADDAAGTDWPDATANAYDGTLVGATVQTASPPGSFSKFVRYDGVDDYSTHTTLGTFGQQVANCTVETVIRLQSTAARTGFGTMNVGTTTWLSAPWTSRTNAGDLAMRVRDDSSRDLEVRTSAAAYTVDTWHHIVYVINGPGGAVAIWVDGTSVGTAVNVASSPGGSISNFAFPYLLAARNDRGTPVSFTQCDIAAYALYPTQLSSARIAAHYSAAGL